MPEESLSDGAANQATRGFFDNDNAPAWDTWIGLVCLERAITTPAGSEYPSETVHLLAWIPEPLEPSMPHALDVNPEECLNWLDDIAPELAALLAARP